MRKPTFTRGHKALTLSLAIALASATLPSFAKNDSKANEAQFTANFKGTELKEFVTIVGKNLNKTFIMDPQLRGKIDVRSYDLMTEEQYYQFFLNVLEVYGFGVVEMENGVGKVVASRDAKTKNIPVVGDDGKFEGDVLVTRVVALKNVNVNDLGPILRQFADQKGAGHIVSYNPSNVILLTGPASQVNRMVEIIQKVDTAGDSLVDIVKLNYASAEDVVDIIDNLYKGQAGKANAVPDFLIPKVVADVRTNAVIVSGEEQARSRALSLIQRLDSELESNGNTKVISLNYAKAEDLVKVLKGVSESIAAEDKSKQAQTRTGKKDISIDAHEQSNSLVITAQPDMMRSLEKVIQDLDVRRAQVLVEAIIVEVYEGNGINLGVQWISESGGMLQFNNGVAPIGGVAVAGLQARTVKGESRTTKDTNGGEQTVTSPDKLGDFTGLANLLGGVNGMMAGIVKDNWAAIVQAVSTDTNSNVLATPSITTMDNEEAAFLVGQEVAILTGSTASSSNSNPFNTVDRKEVGIKLKVTPQINEGDGVQLTIEQEVSGVSGASGVDVAINKRSIKTTVMADDGKTVVLGGLIDEDVQESIAKVPLLGDIPILGHLFKSTSTTKKKRNLLVFIRPTIVRDAALMNSISHKKYKFIRTLQDQQQEDGINLMPFEKTPTLPTWNDELALPPTFEDYLLEEAKKNND